MRGVFTYHLIVNGGGVRGMGEGGKKVQTSSYKMGHGDGVNIQHGVNS